MGIGWNCVGRGVASDTRNLQFESSHRQILFTNNLRKAVLKRRKYRKEAGNGHFLKKQIVLISVKKPEWALGERDVHTQFRSRPQVCLRPECGRLTRPAPSPKPSRNVEARSSRQSGCTARSQDCRWPCAVWWWTRRSASSWSYCSEARLATADRDLDSCWWWRHRCRQRSFPVLVSTSRIDLSPSERRFERRFLWRFLRRRETSIRTVALN